MDARAHKGRGIRGLTYSKKDEVEHSENVVLRSNNVDLDTGKLDLSDLKYIANSINIPSAKKVSRGALLMCMANGSKAHLGKVALIDRDLDYAFGGFMGLIVPNAARSLGDYLYWVLSAYEFKKLIVGLTDGANINNLKFADIADFEFPLPPLPVQHSIVERLERELGAVDKLAKKFEELETAAEAEFKAELKETFEGLGDVKQVKLGEVLETILTRGHQIKQREIRKIGALPVVSQSEKAIEGFTDVSMAITDVPLVLFGDHTCVVKLIKHPFVVGADGVKLLRVHGTCVEYFYHWLQQATLKLLDGEYRRHFSDLSELTISLPPLDAQRSIVSRLDTAKEKKEALVAAAKRGRETATLWRKAILKEAFE